LPDKYQPLYEYLSDSGLEWSVLSFAKIEDILGTALPPSARNIPGWWSNRRQGSPQSAAWMNAGYEVMAIDLGGEVVTFSRRILPFHQLPDGTHQQWDSDSVKAMRLRLGLTQAELAEELGVRQQTISEWERGAYAPSRAMSKYLSRLAQESGLYEGSPRKKRLDPAAKGDSRLYLH